LEVKASPSTGIFIADYTEEEEDRKKRGIEQAPNQFLLRIDPSAENITSEDMLQFPNDGLYACGWEISSSGQHLFVLGNNGTLFSYRVRHN